MNFLLENWTTILEVGAAVLTLASLIVGLTPTPKDDEILKNILTWVSFIKPKDADGSLKVPFKK